MPSYGHVLLCYSQRCQRSRGGLRAPGNGGRVPSRRTMCVGVGHRESDRRPGIGHDLCAGWSDARRSLCQGYSHVICTRGVMQTHEKRGIVWHGIRSCTLLARLRVEQGDRDYPCARQSRRESQKSTKRPRRGDGHRPVAAREACSRFALSSRSSGSASGVRHSRVPVHPRKSLLLREGVDVGSFGSRPARRLGCRPG